MQIYYPNPGLPPYLNPMQVRVYRHGESLSNAGGRTDDPALIPLTDVGHAQASALADGLEPAPDLLVISPFLRSSETAEPIRARFPVLTVETWPVQEFTYLSPVACIGTTWLDRKPLIDAYWARLDPDRIDGPGAESFRDLLDRASAFLRRLSAVTRSDIVVISHGQFMQATKLIIDQPGIEARDAMRLFVERQAASPFLNCERLELRRIEGQLVVRH